VVLERSNKCDISILDPPKSAKILPLTPNIAKKKNMPSTYMLFLSLHFDDDFNVFKTKYFCGRRISIPKSNSISKLLTLTFDLRFWGHQGVMR
jgi:hypothetical protein